MSQADTGRVFLENSNWMVETKDGIKISVWLGQGGDLHPILYRGKDENIIVTFVRINGKAAIVCRGEL